MKARGRPALPLLLESRANPPWGCSLLPWGAGALRVYIPVLLVVLEVVGCCCCAWAAAHVQCLQRLCMLPALAAAEVEHSVYFVERRRGGREELIRPPAVCTAGGSPAYNHTAAALAAVGGVSIRVVSRP
jgi:hypothetical protein